MDSILSPANTASVSFSASLIFNPLIDTGYSANKDKAIKT